MHKSINKKKLHLISHLFLKQKLHINISSSMIYTKLHIL